MARRIHPKPAPRPKPPRAKHPRPLDVPATHRTPAAGSVRAWTQSPHSGAGATGGSSPTRELALPAERANGDPGLAAVLIELAGAERGDLRAALGIWQREQDRLMNRAWRRPGGLARPAGL